jgi:hypothetical protein
MSTTETLWGVGTWVERGGARRPLEVSPGEMQRDIASATRALRELGVTAGTRVLWCSMLSEAVQVWPLVLATMLSGAQLSCADATEGEAARVAMFTRLMDYHAVMGVNAAILEGLDTLGRDCHDVFGGVSVVGARPDAYDRVLAAGLRPQHFVLVGPAVAIAREPGGPAVVDGEEWAAELVEGYVAVTAKRERAMQFTRAVTDVGATSVHGTEITLV